MIRKNKGSVSHIPSTPGVPVLEPRPSDVFIFLVDNMLDILEMLLNMVGTGTHQSNTTWYRMRPTS